MKKFIKIFLASLLLIVISISLCSCRQLDDMKKSHGVYTNAAKTEIEIDGKIFKKLNLDNTYIIYEGLKNNAIYYITNKDVPVLLSSTYGDYAALCQNKNGDEFLNVNRNVNSVNSYGGEYCEESCYDKYNDIENSQKNIEFDNYYINYTGKELTVVNELLDKKYKDIFDESMTEKNNLPSDITINRNEASKEIYINRCDKDMIFGYYDDYSLIKYKVGDSDYILLNEHDPLYKTKGDYVVPAKYNDAIDELFAYYDSVNYISDTNYSVAYNSPTKWLSPRYIKSLIELYQQYS